MDVHESAKMLQLFPFSSLSSVVEEEEEVAVVEEPVVTSNKRKPLSKQLSTRDAKWEKRRQQILNRRTRSVAVEAGAEEEEEEERRVRSPTDEDLAELRGSIELGFGFNEENGGHNLRDTLPALDLYFAVNRQLSDPKHLWPSFETPTAASSSSSSSSCSNPSPRSPNEQEPPQRNSNASDSWKICNPGDDPQHVKMRLRQWAQVVACSVAQSRPARRLDCPSRN